MARKSKKTVEETVVETHSEVATVTADQVEAAFTALVPMAERASACIEKGDKALDKADQMYRSAGVVLIDAKAKLEEANKLAKAAGQATIAWTKWLKENVPFSQSKAYQCIAIANGETTIEDIRKANAERQAKLRGKSAEKPEKASKADTSADDDEGEEISEQHAALIEELCELIKVMPEKRLQKLYEALQRKVI